MVKTTNAVLAPVCLHHAQHFASAENLQKLHSDDPCTTCARQVACRETYKERINCYSVVCILLYLDRLVSTYEVFRAIRTTDESDAAARSCSFLLATRGAADKPRVTLGMRPVSRRCKRGAFTTRTCQTTVGHPQRSHVQTRPGRRNKRVIGQLIVLR
jgi:hypothetical protein